MALVNINATDGRAVLNGTTQDPYRELARIFARLPARYPVIIMIHGYKYLPGHRVHCPHASLFGRDGTPNSWPERLGATGTDNEGCIAIGFGWNARGSLQHAYGAAADAAQVLGGLIDRISAIAPDRAVHLIGHSLGARVALQSFGHLKTGQVKTLIALAPAEFDDAFCTALATPVGRSCRLLHVTSRENALFDLIAERLIRAPKAGARMIGRKHVSAANVATLQLDCELALMRLGDLGYPISRKSRQVCHWSPYLRGGVFSLYRSILSEKLPFDWVQQALEKSRLRTA